MPVSLNHSFTYFKSLLVGHSVDRPPWSVQVFSLEDVKLITEYVTNTYYRHYKLYNYAFNKRQILNFNHQVAHSEPSTTLQLQEEQSKHNTPAKAWTKSEEDNNTKMEQSNQETEIPKTAAQIEDKTSGVEEKLLHSDSSAPKTPLDRLTMHVETIASQSAAMIVQEHMSHLKEELEKQLKQHEEQLLLKVNMCLYSL